MWKQKWISLVRILEVTVHMTKTQPVYNAGRSIIHEASQSHARHVTFFVFQVSFPPSTAVWILRCQPCTPELTAMCPGYIATPVTPVIVRRHLDSNCKQRLRLDFIYLNGLLGNCGLVTRITPLVTNKETHNPCYDVNKRCAIVNLSYFMKSMLYIQLQLSYWVIYLSKLIWKCIIYVFLSDVHILKLMT